MTAGSAGGVASTPVGDETGDLLDVQPEPQAPVPDASRWDGDVRPMTTTVESTPDGGAVETIARVIRAYFGPGWLADGSENTSSMRCARAVAEALSSMLAAQSPVRVDGETDEVFEVVDRLNGRRAMEHVHPTAQAALNWLGALDEKYHRQYRVQSVPMFRASS